MMVSSSKLDDLHIGCFRTDEDIRVFCLKPANKEHIFVDQPVDRPALIVSGSEWGLRIV